MSAPPVGHTSFIRPRVLWLLAVIVLALYANAPAGAAPLKEKQLKAAYLYNILKFVEWPATTDEDARVPFSIGIMHDDVLRQELEVIVKGRRINGRDIVIVDVTTVEQAGAVHLLFVPAGQESQFSSMQPQLRELPILDVGESARFASIGGTIRLTQVGDKLRFEINMTPAERAGLKISVQLQKLAALVRRGS